MSSHTWWLCATSSPIFMPCCTPFMGRLIFCADNRIPHFFLRPLPLMKISCSSTHLNTLRIHTEGVIVISGALAIIMASYACIISAVRQSPQPKAASGEPFTLRLPPHCGGYILWDPHLGLLPAPYQLFSGWGSYPDCHIHSSDPHVEPFIIAYETRMSRSLQGNG